MKYQLNNATRPSRLRTKDKRTLYMIITDEIKQHCENTISTKDPDKIHHHKTGFYIGYALSASEVESLKAQKEIDRQEIERFKAEINKLKEMLLDDIAVFGIADSLNPGVLPTRASNMEQNLKSMGYEL